MSAAHTRKGTSLLALGAIGVVFGDIGTSPLYALRATLEIAGGVQTAEMHVMGALSLMVWGLLIIIGAKYIALVMRADNGGEGGLLSLLALASTQDGEPDVKRGRLIFWLALQLFKKIFFFLCCMEINFFYLYFAIFCLVIYYAGSGPIPPPLILYFISELRVS